MEQERTLSPTVDPPASSAGGRLRRVGQHLQESGTCIALLARELHEFRDLAAKLALGGCSDDMDAPSRTHLEQAFIAKDAQSTQHRVGVDVHHGRQVTSWREALTRRGLALGDGAADLCRDLLMEVSWIPAVNVDIKQCAI